MGSKSAPPPAPDYKGAAEATAAGNRVAAQQTTVANRPNIITPYGSQTWANDRKFDQGGYDAELAKYNASVKPGGYETVIDGEGNQTQQWNPGTKPTGDAPDRNSFMTDNWTQNTTLTPATQRALESQQQMQQGRSDLANSMMGRVSSTLSAPIDTAGLQDWGKRYDGAGPITSGFAMTTPTTTDKIQTSIGSTPGYIKSSGDAIYNQATSRLDPRFNQGQSDLDSRLANQGITAGSSAYNRAQDNFSMQRNDAYQSAMNNATAQSAADASRVQGMDINQGNFGNTAQQQVFGQNVTANQFQNQSIGQSNQAQNQNFTQTNANAAYDNNLRISQFNMQQQQRLQELNEMNALMTGQQVNMPSMPQFNTATPYGGANYTGAATAQGQYDMNTYNANNASSSGLTSGLFQLGGSAMMANAMSAAPFMLSDSRLKRVVQKLGRLANGLNVYRFKYLGMPETHVGVMAQEVAHVRPDCVVKTGSGYLAVNYGKLLGA